MFFNAYSEYFRSCPDTFRFFRTYVFWKNQKKTKPLNLRRIPKSDEHISSRHLRQAFE